MTNTFCPHTGGLFKPPALPVVMTALMSSGCEYSEKEYMAKVNIATEYQRLAQQRQAALVAN